MRATIIVAFAMSLGASATQAANDIVLFPAGGVGNGTQLAIDGVLNSLVILQDATSVGPANSLQVTLTGDGNGGPAASKFDPIAAAGDLQPGSLTQQGFGNLMTIDVQGQRQPVRRGPDR